MDFHNSEYIFPGTLPDEGPAQRRPLLAAQQEAEAGAREWRPVSASIHHRAPLTAIIYHPPLRHKTIQPQPFFFLAIDGLILDEIILNLF